MLNEAGFKEKFLLFLGRRKKFRVEGNSMIPLIYHGERILVKKVKSYQVSDVVVSQHPVQSDVVIVKQVQGIDEKGRLKLVGLNRLESSHLFGLIHPTKILGKVTGKLD